jgi:hypothetical protein
MISPVKRKKTSRRIPIDVDSLYRKHERGDKRVNVMLLNDLLDREADGEKIAWSTFGKSLIKPGRRVPSPQ